MYLTNNTSIVTRIHTTRR